MIASWTKEITNTKCSVFCVDMVVLAIHGNVKFQITLLIVLSKYCLS